MSSQSAVDDPAFRAFQANLDRLVETFGRNLADYKSNRYDEASLRQEFLNPLFRALGWDVENQTGQIPQHREVEIESRTDIGGRQKRADYLFRTDRIDRFICEAKKPADELQAAGAFQAKRYAWNKGLFLAVLTNFEEIRLYVVGSKPHPEELGVGLWKTWRSHEYPLVAREIWDLLSRSSVAGGALERVIDSLPRKPAAKGKARQQWLFKPDRSRALDTDFLNFLDEARRELASDLIRRNDRADLLEDNRLNEAVQRILDRLLFLRICEDRDIDTGRPLAQILRSWRDHAESPVPRKPRQSEFELRETAAEYAVRAARPPKPGPFWREVVAHFQALDRRPPSHIPFFNGNLFKPHFSEELEVGDEWIAGFLDDIGDEESPYLFNVIPVEILGTIYERFLGKVVRPQGRGVTIEEKPEVRKAGGVYYTPRYIVDYIVEQTVGKLLEGRKPEKSLDLRILDPACGSGSFLIRAYERVCEHWQTAFTKNERKRRRDECWTDPVTQDVHLTTHLKRRILTANIHGVDLDSGAVEVTQLSLYLKMLEGENRTTLAAERDLFGNDIALLPPLQDNIKCGNSLIASDFSMIPEDLVRVKAFDWDVQFARIMKDGGFDAVVGNPPYVFGEYLDPMEKTYMGQKYDTARGQWDLYHVFFEAALRLTRLKGLHGYIVPDAVLARDETEKLRRLCTDDNRLRSIAHPGCVFEGVGVSTAVLITESGVSPPDEAILHCVTAAEVKRAVVLPLDRFRSTPGRRFLLEINNQGTMLVNRLGSLPRKVGDVCRFSRGEELGKKNLVRSASLGRGGEWIVVGEDVCRYGIGPRQFQIPKSMVAKPRSLYAGPKVVVVKTGRTPVAALDLQDRVTLQSLYNLQPLDGKERTAKLVLGILNSGLAAWYLQTTVTEGKLLFPQFNQRHLADIRLPLSEPETDSETRVIDCLVKLVDKMLALVPKLRAAKSEQERRTLQNAVTATDRQIDALVYELYGLTPEEIALVEGKGQ